MKTIGVVGHKGKLGSRLVKRPSFSAFICDITSQDAIKAELSRNPVDLLVNCAGISSIEQCEKNYDEAILVNVHGTENLHKVFGPNVVSIGSDHLFNGKSSNSSEDDDPDPINNYGFTKMAVEAIAHIYGGKVIRLSRVVSYKDSDISYILNNIALGYEMMVPDFIYRNYVSPDRAVSALDKFAHEFEVMPSVLNYGSFDTVSMFQLLRACAVACGLDMNLIKPRKHDDKDYSPRPLKGGYDVKLASSVYGFSTPSYMEAVYAIAQERKDR